MAIFDLSKKSPSRFCPESQTTFPSPFWGVFYKKRMSKKDAKMKREKARICLNSISVLILRSDRADPGGPKTEADSDGPGQT